MTERRSLLIRVGSIGRKILGDRLLSDQFRNNRGGLKFCHFGRSRIWSVYHTCHRPYSIGKTISILESPLHEQVARLVQASIRSSFTLSTIYTIIMTIGGVSAAQAWAILQRHAQDEVGPLRLQELCRDNDRVSSLVAVHNTTSETFSMTTTDHPDQREDRMLLVDISRQRMTNNTLNHLLQLASARNLKQFITKLSWGGQNDPSHPIIPARLSEPEKTSSQHRAPKHYSAKTHEQPQHPNQGGLHLDASKTARFEGDKERGVFKQSAATGGENTYGGTVPPRIDTRTNTFGSDADAATVFGPSPPPSSMHMALRVPQNKGCEMLLQDGTNALDGIHYEWNRMERLSNLIRAGSFRGATGNMIETILIIGSGVAVEALQFTYNALLHDERAVLQSRAGLDQNKPLLARGPRNILSSVAAAATGQSSSGSPKARQLVFLTSLDSLAAAEAMSELDASKTLVISIALRGNEETGLITSLLKQWLLQELGSNGSSGGTTAGSKSSSQQLHGSNATTIGNTKRSADLILSRHMMLITGNKYIASTINKPESVHVLPQECRAEAFTTFTAATLLPIAIVFGWATAKEFLAGAHDIDLHFVNTNPRHNLPILLALTDIWNDVLLGNQVGRIVTPFSQPFKGYPAYCAALEAQVCGNTAPTMSHRGSGANDGVSPVGAAASPHPSTMRRGRTGHARGGCSSLVVDGGLSTYSRLLYQSDVCIMNSEIVLALDCQLQFNAIRRLNLMPSSQLNDTVTASQDAMVCSAFAHADELAFGGMGDNFSSNKSDSTGTYSFSPSAGPGTPSGATDLERLSRGNRPSSLLICNKIDAFACGQLIALAEHRATVKAHICGQSSWHQELGSSLRMVRTDHLKEGFGHILSAIRNGDDDDENEESVRNNDMNLSTRTILKHYARLAKGAR